MGNFLGGSKPKDLERRANNDDEIERDKLPTLFQTSILFLGLDNCGKSSIIEYMTSKYRLRNSATGVSGSSSRVCSTLIDSFIDGYCFQVIEITGRYKDRSTIWRQNLACREYDAVVYVIDISPDDSFRLHYSLELFRDVLYFFQNKPVLVFLNKSDENFSLEGDQKSRSGVSYMEHNFEASLQNILSEQAASSISSVVKCSAKAGTGIREGIQWLCHSIDITVKCLSPSLISQPFDFQIAPDTVADHSAVLLSPQLGSPPPNSDIYVLASPTPVKDPVTYVQSLWS